VLACGLAASLLGVLLCISNNAEEQSVQYEALCLLSEALLLIEDNVSQW